MIRFLAVAAFVCFVTFPSPESRVPSPGQVQAVRFHHVHFRVGDPAVAMNEAATKLGGTRVIVPGLGVGVRTDAEFVLFDRLDESDPPDLLQQDVARAYGSAVGWLQSRGISAAPASWASTRIVQAHAGRYHHLGFVTGDYEDTIARIGVAPVKRTSESALFDAGGGVLVEIVRENDLPDAFWCPMHPDVRSGTAGKCPLCRMDLVPLPPPKLGEYRMDVTLEQNTGGMTGMRLAIREPDSNLLVRAFRTVHEKTLHLFIVSRDLEYFAHVHPEQLKDGSFRLDHPLASGEYMLIADFLPEDGPTQMIQRAIIVSKTGARGSGPGARGSGLGARDSEDLRVSMKAENLVAGKDGRLTFTVTDAKTGTPVTDLEPYLGAPAHMLIVRRDLSDAVHEHPEEHSTGGPTVSFHPVMPAAGDYKLWIQLQRQGRVFTFPFEVRAGQ